MIQGDGVVKANSSFLTREKNGRQNQQSEVKMGVGGNFKKNKNV
jgi:hypothetical protein